MIRSRAIALGVSLLVLTVVVSAATSVMIGKRFGHAQRHAEPVDLDVVTRIRHEALHRSEVMNHLEHLTDVIGPRLTGSPALLEANEWTRDTLAAWGLEDARLEPFEFGKGWSFDRVSVHLVEPRVAPIIAYPRAWTPGTGGEVRGEVVRVKLADDDDLEEQRGKLEGKILLLDEPRDIPEDTGSPFQRHDERSLQGLVEFPIPDGGREAWRQRRLEEFAFREKRNEFLASEGVLATLHISSRDFGIVRLGAGAAHDPDAHPGVPSLQVASEHYNLLARLAARDEPTVVALDIEARFHEDDLQAHNTLAELPGRARGGELVLVGAHLDSWHAGQGATDNAAGVAVVMEAVRILRALELRPRRTIRVALWAGEEQGLLGSRAYVERHIATRPAHTAENTSEEQLALPARLRDPTWPIEPLRGHRQHAVYFNLDNGSGRIRGIHAQENAAVVPIFEDWLVPFHDLGASTVTLRNTGSTDHIPFDQVGVPGFQFIQDRLDYFARTHHTHLDTRDHVQRKDLMQAAAVLASFLYHAAERDDPLPRKPLPTQPPEPPSADDEG
jgi:carboxypeptidase Q